MDRRKFLGAAAGVAGAAAVGTWSPWVDARPGGPNSPIVTSATLGIQHFSVRDATDRPRSSDPNAILGYLGGPTFPENPADIGPLVPLPGGFEEVFQYLKSVGITGFEFFNFNQTQFPTGDARRTPSMTQIRQWLDNAGMKSFGTHTGGVGLLTAGNRRTEIARAQILGHQYIGTAGDPANNSNTLFGWQDSAENFNIMGELLKREGLKLFFHPEGTWWQFFNDPDHPEMNRTHKIDFFAENTDPRLVLFEIDSYHMYNNRGARPDPVDGSLWDAEGFMRRNWKRLMGYHVKDANREVPTQAPSVRGPFTQLQTRTGFPLAGGQDAVYVLEGHLGKGYPIDPGSTPPGARPGPDPSVIGFRRMFTEVRSIRAKGFRYHIIESDQGPGPMPTAQQPPYNPNLPPAQQPHDPGRSLRLAKISARNLLALK
jgi:sugar phosphate isomerase/epimerase